MPSKATLAAGPFHLIAPRFNQLLGVQSVQCGYTGGVTEMPMHDAVSTGRTGHIEALEITFDGNETSYAALLETFWQAHNPTEMNFNGAESGAQHRSAIFYHNAEQRRAALASLGNAQRRFMKPIVTLIEPARKFWPADLQHLPQDAAASNLFQKSGL